MTYLPNSFVGKASVWCLVYRKAEVQIPKQCQGLLGGGYFLSILTGASPTVVFCVLSGGRPDVWRCTRCRPEPAGPARRKHRPAPPASHRAASGREPGLARGHGDAQQHGARCLWARSRPLSRAPSRGGPSLRRPLSRLAQPCDAGTLKDSPSPVLPDPARDPTPPLAPPAESPPLSQT